MKTVIVYFSQTGNTEKVAQAIAKGIENTDNPCILIPLKEVVLEKLKDYDLIGIGTPVFYFQEPWNVRDFIEGLSFLKGKLSFVFCTHGGQDANALPRMARGLKEKGLLILGGLITRGYDSFQPYIEFDYSKGHPDEKDLKEAEEFGQKMVKNYGLVKEANRLDILPESGFKFSLLHLASLWLTKKRVNKRLPKIEVDKEKCIKCGKCAEICPSEAIELNPYPIRRGDCTRCYYCEKICPQEAIIVNWRPTKMLIGFFRICAWPMRALIRETGKV
jgi:flavodoxin/ferredoxin